MSSHPNDKSGGHELDQLHARAQNLRHLLAHQLEKARRKHRGLAIAGALLVVASIAALGNVTRLTFALDAQTLTEIGRAQVEQNLPAGRLSMQSYLESEAPRLAEGVIASLVGSIPSLRPLVMEQVATNLHGISSELERRLQSEMAQVIQISKAQVDGEFPDATESEKVAKLVEIVAARFQDNAQSVFLSLYPDYSAEMERVFQYLEDLRNKPEVSLTRKERLQKEIIQTILRLAIHAHESQKDGGVDW